MCRKSGRIIVAQYLEHCVHETNIYLWKRCMPKKQHPILLTASALVVLELFTRSRWMYEYVVVRLK